MCVYSLKRKNKIMKATNKIKAEIKATELYKLASAYCRMISESFNELPKEALLERYSFFNDIHPLVEETILSLKKCLGTGEESFKSFVFRIANEKA